MCVSYAPLCCRNSQPRLAHLPEVGLGGWSLSQEHSHLIKRKLLSTLNIYTKNMQELLRDRDSLSAFLGFILTCQHAFINDAGAADQNSVTGHNGPVAGNDN